MKRKFVISVFLLSMVTLLSVASGISVNGLWYEFDEESKTAMVTFKGTKWDEYSEEYKNDVEVPETVICKGVTYRVTSIGNEAFRGCVGMTSVTLPTSVRSIGYGAFRGCTVLDNVELPTGVTSIRQETFKGCAGLKNIVLPSGLAYVGDDVFVDCGELIYSEYDNGQYLGNESNPYLLLVKSKSSGITRCTVHDDCRIMTAGVFRGCVGLQEVVLPEGVTVIGDNAFEGCVVLPEIILPRSLRSIGKQAFKGCDGMGVVEVPRNVRNIGLGAFAYCGGLTEINVDEHNVNYSSEDGMLFTKNKGTLLLCPRAKAGELVINESVDTIRPIALRGCKGLTSVIIGSGVSDLNLKALGECTALTEINVDEHNVNYSSEDGMLFTKNKSTLLLCPRGKNDSVEIPSMTSVIGDEALKGCSEVKEILIKGRISKVGEDAFEECGGLTLSQYNNAYYAGRKGMPYMILMKAVATDIENCTVHSSCCVIYDRAFDGCDQLKSVTMSNGVVHLGNNVFRGCRSLNSLTLSNMIERVGIGVFEGCSSLGLKKYGNAYYLGGINNPYMVLAKAESDEITNCYVHSSCISFGEGAFRGCRNLKSITNCYNVNSIGAEAFKDCMELTEMPTMSRVDYMGEGAFAGCENLIEVTITNGLGTIADGAFQDCLKLTDITMNDNVKSIGMRAFSGSVVRELDVPNNVALLDSSLVGCDSLKVLQLESDFPAEGGLYQLQANAKLKVPFGKEYQYRFHYGIPDGNVLPIMYDIRVVSDNRNKGWTTGSGEFGKGQTAHITATANSGYHFIRWSDGNTNAARDVTVTKEMTYTAYFGANVYSITVKSENINMGTVSGGSNYEYGENAYIKATPKTGYHFVRWNDGNTSASRSVTVYGNVTYTAYFAANEYSVNIVSGNSTMGSVSGSGTYLYGERVYLSASAKTGYHFVEWSDGYPYASRYVTIDKASSYTAIFAPNDYTITVRSDNSVMGSATGGGYYEYGEYAYIKATPKTGYHFERWSDGSTSRSRYVEVTGNRTYTAYFATNDFRLTVYANNSTMGSVTGGGYYYANELAHITATAKTGYHFVRWNDGSTSSSRYVTMTGDVTYTAIFEENGYTLTVNSNSSTMGSVTGGGIYDYYSTVYLTATAKAGYHFVEWSDGSTARNRYVTVRGDATYTARFASNDYTVTVLSNNSNLGYTSGSGSYADGERVRLTASSYSGSRFDRWSDGNTSSSRYITVMGNETYIAYFVKNYYTVSVTSENSYMGTVSGNGSYAYSDRAYLQAIAKTGYHFVRWSDGNTSANRSVTVVGDKTYTATFAEDDYTLTVRSNDEMKGTVSGGGNYSKGDVARLTATAKTGYHFVKWNDGNTSASRNVTVTANATYYATFAVNDYTLVVRSNDETKGTVMGGGSYSHGETAHLVATAATDCHFVKWNDGNTNASRTVTVTASATYNATFAMNDYTLTVKANDNNKGTVTGGGEYAKGETVRLNATPKTGYHFVEWSDGVTTQSRSVVVIANATYTAKFAINEYVLIVRSNDEAKGTVSGGGTYEHGKTVTLTATPNEEKYEFVQWNDGNKASERQITVSSSGTYIAEFAQKVEFGFKEFVWAEDSLSATAVLVDKYDETSKKEKKITAKLTTKKADCGIDGYRRFTVTYTEDGDTHTDYKETKLSITNKEVVKKMWNNVLSVVNPDHYLRDIKWYHNDEYLCSDDFIVERPYLTGTYRLTAMTTSGEKVCSTILKFGSFKRDVEMKVYPNPARDQITVVGDNWEIGDEAMLIELDGDIVKRQKIESEKEFIMTLESAATGVYHVKVNDQIVRVIVNR